MEPSFRSMRKWCFPTLLCHNALSQCFLQATAGWLGSLLCTARDYSARQAFDFWYIHLKLEPSKVVTRAKNGQKKVFKNEVILCTS